MWQSWFSGIAGKSALELTVASRTHPKTCFVARLSEKAVGKAEVRKARRRTEVR